MIQFTPTEIYAITLVVIIAASIGLGFLIAWPIAKRIGYRDGAVDGYEGCLEEFFDENGDLKDSPDTVLDAEEVS